MPRFTLICPTVCPQYTNVTDRTGQDRQTTVRWHRTNRFTNGRPKTKRSIDTSHTTEVMAIFVTFVTYFGQHSVAMATSLDPCNQKCIFWINSLWKLPVISHHIIVICPRNAYITIFVPKFVVTVTPLCPLCTGVSKYNSLVLTRHLDLDPLGQGTPLGPWYIWVTNPQVHLVSKFSAHLVGPNPGSRYTWDIMYTNSKVHLSQNTLSPARSRSWFTLLSKFSTQLGPLTRKYTLLINYTNHQNIGPFQSTDPLVQRPWYSNMSEQNSTKYIKYTWCCFALTYWYCNLIWCLLLEASSSSGEIFRVA